MFNAVSCLLLLVLAAEGAWAGLIGACASCGNYCQYGYQTSAARCSCTCKPPPCSPLNKCGLVCKNGFKKDANGCLLCQCQCPELASCQLCPYGYLPVNATACPECPKCRCRDDPCPLECPPQYRSLGPLDVYGCPTCNCFPPECAPCECHGELFVVPPTGGYDCAPCPPCPCFQEISSQDCPPPKILVTEHVNGTGCPAYRCVCPPLPTCPVCQYGEDPAPLTTCPSCPTCRPAPTCPPDNCGVIECPEPNIIVHTDVSGCRHCTCRIDCPPNGTPPSGGYGCP